ncbi:hypothetical protein ACS0TY_002725 [Phlomoides rotata]
MKIWSYSGRGLGGRAKKKEIKNMARNQSGKDEGKSMLAIWDIRNFDWVNREAVGNSVSILTIWNTEIPKNGKRCTIINVYAPKISSQRWEL